MYDGYFHIDLEEDGPEVDFYHRPPRTRLSRHADGSIAPQILVDGQWHYRYDQDGTPIAFPSTDAGYEEAILYL